MAKWKGGKSRHELLCETAEWIASALGVELGDVRHVTTVLHDGRRWTVEHQWQCRRDDRWERIELETWQEID